jgi:hypothetical protein
MWAALPLSAFFLGGNMKTLGQIAYEAVHDAYTSFPSWEHQAPSTHRDYELMAQAVRAQVIEECASFVEDYAEYPDGYLISRRLLELKEKKETT